MSSMQMTPLKIAIALHYYGRTDDYRDGDFSALAVGEAIRDLVSAGLLIDETSRLTQRCYAPSEGLRLYVEALTIVPCPVQRWVMPDPLPSHPRNDVTHGCCRMRAAVSRHADPARSTCGRHETDPCPWQERDALAGVAEEINHG